MNTSLSRVLRLSGLIYVKCLEQGLVPCKHFRTLITVADSVGAKSYLLASGILTVRYDVSFSAISSWMVIFHSTFKEHFRLVVLCQRLDTQSLSITCYLRQEWE